MRLLSGKFEVISPNMVVAGYASTLIEDTQGEVITPDMLRESAKGYMENGVVFLSHRRDEPAGLILKEFGTHRTQIDEVGWYIVSRPSAANRNHIRELISGGLLTGYSIGGRRLADGRIEINDVSYVPRPANKLSYHKIISKSESIFERLKNAESFDDELRVIEGELRDARLSRAVSAR